MEVVEAVVEVLVMLLQEKIIIRMELLALQVEVVEHMAVAEAEEDGVQSGGVVEEQQHMVLVQVELVDLTVELVDLILLEQLE